MSIEQPLFARYVNRMVEIARKDFCGKITLNFQFGNVTNMNVEQSFKLPDKEEKK